MKKALLTLLFLPAITHAMQQIRGLDDDLLILEDADQQYRHYNGVFAGQMGERAYMQGLVSYRDNLLEVRTAIPANAGAETMRDYTFRLTRLSRLITNFTRMIDPQGLLNELVMNLRSLHAERLMYPGYTRKAQIAFEHQRSIFGACRDAITQAFGQNYGLLPAAINALLTESDQILTDVDQAIMDATIARYPQQN